VTWKASTRSEVRLSDATLAALDGVPPPWPGEQVEGVFVRTAPGPQGGGEPAVLVHGLGGASTNWTDLMALLRGQLDSQALDLPGFGWSPPPTNDRYGLGTHVRAVVRLLEAQDRGPVHLFGNSLGGAVCTRVAAYRPDLVRTLTLVSPALPSLTPRRVADPRLPLLLLPGMARLASRAMARRTPDERARAVMELCYGDPSSIPEQRRQEAAQEIGRRSGLTHADRAFTGSLRGLLTSYLEGGPRNLWRQAATVRVPTLLVWGALDRLVHVSLAPRARAAFPHSRLLVLPGVGHVAQLERPETVARAFLALREDAADQGAPRTA